MKRTRLALCAVCLLLILSGAGCSRQATGSAHRRDQQLVIFHAGSLSVPFRRLSHQFQNMHPRVQVRAEAAGSRDCARKVCDLKRRCDVLASADYRVIENLLRPDYASFNIRFAGNEMTIAFKSSSRGADAIHADNWYRILQRGGVTFGYSDPNSDPCGYRAMMLLQLAEQCYGAYGLAEALVTKHGGRYVRPKATDLLALLEADELDYVFIYRSVAKQHRLRALDLPDAINLSDPSQAEAYRGAAVDVTGKHPGDTIRLRGAPVVYSVTIPHTAEAPALAEEYLSLLLSVQGQRIMRSCGQKVIAPARATNFESVPVALRPLCEEVPPIE